MKTVILLSGKLQSGKNQTAEYLRELLEDKNFNVSQDLFAKDVKDGAKEDFKLLQAFLNSEINKIRLKMMMLKSASGNLMAEHVLDDLNELLFTDDNYYEHKTPLTRILLQLYGTEIFRNRVDNDHWTNLVIERCKNDDYDFKLITDTRFENEVNKLRYNPFFNTITIRIERPNYNRDDNSNNHDSETGLDNYNDWDFKIINDKDLNHLKSEVEKIISEL